MRALITGITGQDGSYLASLLLKEGFQVHGLVRRSSNPAARENIAHFEQNLTLHLGSITDYGRLAQVFREVMPDIIFNLAAQSHVGAARDIPNETYEINGMGSYNVMAAAAEVLGDRAPRFIQACTSDMFADVPGPLTETSPIQARNAYALGKIAAYEAGCYFRETGKLNVTNAIMFNHESPRKPDIFVTRKITKAAARIKLGVQSSIRLGNLESCRDWGYAGDTVHALYLLSGRNIEPGDYVVATGRTASVREFATCAFNKVGLSFEAHYEQDPNMLRGVDFTHAPFGDASKLGIATGWSPQTSLEQMIEMMAQEDMRREAFLLTRS